MAADERQRRWGDLDDARAAVGIEQIGAAEVVKERSAIVTVTDHAVDRLQRGVRNPPENLPIATVQLGVFAHLGSEAGLRAALAENGHVKFIFKIKNYERCCWRPIHQRVTACRIYARKLTPRVGDEPRGALARRRGAKALQRGAGRCRL